MSQTQAVHTDSINSQDPNNEGEKKAKSRRPANTAFRQQRLKAWQPILTPKTVLPLFFAIGIIFAPIGGLLLYASAQVQEIAIDYSDCLNAPRTFTNISSGKVSTYFKSSTCTQPITPQWKLGSRVVDYSPYGIQLNSSICSLQFTVPNNIGPPVLLYYRLTNFYQNHRRYVKSLDSNQLSGDAVPVSTITKGSCDPLRLGPKEKPYYPCGLIANSIFNDTFFNPVLTNVKDSAARNRTYNMTNKGIAWDSDKSLYGKTKYSIENITVPPNWKERWPNGYTADNPPPDLSNYEEFQVWMRTAGLPAFSKLALRNDKEPMDCGTYQVDIALNFPVTEYGGTKSIVISTRTVMGGKNPFLGIAYIVVAGICVVLGVIFTVTHLIKPRKLGDHTYLSWNNDQPSTATATGVSRPGNDAA
ncbi:MAG: LEM3 CDC50 family [Lasallia pustulata]|uniref:LEM3 CDC50 family n=1 Tax=Lasallia pustulata TaxID=136370 RepID=A0A5M8PMF5_9LECA|nr:MAG: LEM3 CDC50 family [Lasallia pustulata]